MVSSAISTQITAHAVAALWSDARRLMGEPYDQMEYDNDGKMVRGQLVDSVCNFHSVSSVYDVCRIYHKKCEFEIEYKKGTELGQNTYTKIK